MSLEQALKQALTDALAEAVAEQFGPILNQISVNSSVESVNPDNILNREQAAAYLKLATTTLAIMASQKRGPNYFRIGRSVRYRKSDLDQFLEDNRGLVGRKGRPPARPIIVRTNGSVRSPAVKREEV